MKLFLKKNSYPYWFSSAALPARRLWRIPVDAQTVPRVNRPEEKMTLLMISRSDIFILFHLQNTSFFLGFSRMPLSSAAMATIPLQKDINLYYVGVSQLEERNTQNQKESL